MNQTLGRLSTYQRGGAWDSDTASLPNRYGTSTRWDRGSDGDGADLVGDRGADGDYTACDEIRHQRSKGGTPHRRGEQILWSLVFGAEEGGGGRSCRGERARGQATRVIQDKVGRDGWVAQEKFTRH